jgi:hypothetical protein
MDQTKKISLRAMKLKTAFLVAFATAHHRGEHHRGELCALLHHHYKHMYDWSSITLHTDPTFIAKMQIVATVTSALHPVEIK